LEPAARIFAQAAVDDLLEIARHVAAIRRNCEPRHLDCRRRQRQAVLHWAYDSRKI
jgi:hypothetical protein